MHKFNQDTTGFSRCTPNSLTLYTTDPLGSYYTQETAFSHVAMLFSTSLICVVPAASPKRLKFINTKKNSTICELTFPSPILDVALNRKRLCVLLEAHVYIYDISCMSLLQVVELPVTQRSRSNSLLSRVAASAANVTGQWQPGTAPARGTSPSQGTPPSMGTSPSPSPDGNGHVPLPQQPVMGLSMDDSSILAFSNSNSVTILDTVTGSTLGCFVAHQNDVAALAISNDGSHIATASTKGTIVRTFNISGLLVDEFRRGNLPGGILSLKWSHDNKHIGCVSSNTVHVFRAGESRRKSWLKALEPKRDFAFIPKGDSVIGWNAKGQLLLLQDELEIYCIPPSGGECILVRNQII